LPNPKGPPPHEIDPTGQPPRVPVEVVEQRRRYLEIEADRAANP
jgi:hypothetical protein